MLLASFAVEAPVNAAKKGYGAIAGQRRQGRMELRANRRQAVIGGKTKLNQANNSLSNQNNSGTTGNPAQTAAICNDEHHWVGHDRKLSGQRQQKRNRTETVDNNETITIGANAAPGGANSLMEDEGIYYYRKKAKRRLRNANLPQ